MRGAATTVEGRGLGPRLGLSLGPRLGLSLGLSLSLSLAGLALGCRADPPSGAAETTATTETTETTADPDAGETGDPPKERATVTHGFPTHPLGPREERQVCLQWTPSNARSLYVQAVTLANEGGIHHSNWYIVPEYQYLGDDGYFECADRQLTEYDAFFVGTMLAAQSTQARYERMEFPEGVVVEIPPFYKLVAGVHLLNPADAESDAELRLSLELAHPRDVEQLATPVRFSFYDLEIPAFTEVRHTSACNLASAYQSVTGRSFDLRLHWVMPHYHSLGNYFDLSIAGGPRDGHSVYRLEGFDAGPHGQAYPEPVDLRGSNGLRFTCGHDNWTDRTLGWGIGGHEMCSMLALVSSSVLLDGAVPQGGGHVAGTEGSLLLREGTCGVLGTPAGLQDLPNELEREAPLYVPPVAPEDEGLLPVDDCADVPADTMLDGPPTLSRVRDTLLVSSCQFSSCHQGADAAAGLDLGADDLYAELLEHEVLGDTDLPLVAPGDPEGSWLYRRVAECAPTDRHGDVVPHMPPNAPRLADPTMVAGLRAWIESGAPDG
ncbi:MAG: hypothetical protein KDK70_14495 [Myxococcales bacterium]|nr:hypothetical protein [Myxococcales bacterium]